MIHAACSGHNANAKSAKRAGANEKVQIIVQILPPSLRLLLTGCALLLASCAVLEPLPDLPEDRVTLTVTLPAGWAEVDVYRPPDAEPAPMLIIAHGFSRGRHNMAGWGRYLADAGVITVVPDLPAWADHERNAQFLVELQAELLSDAEWRARIDARRLGLMGYSAGGLASLLAAAELPNLMIWIGLDPVDRSGLGAAAAGRVLAQTVVITAEPSACNAHGNAAGMVDALPAPETRHITGAVHADAEWPGSRLADLACEPATAEGRAAFRRQAASVLLDAFGLDSENQAND